MSSAIEERECLTRDEVEYLPGHLVAINWNEFVVLPEDVSDSSAIYKYNLTNDQFEQMMPVPQGKTNTYMTIFGAVFDPKTAILYLSNHHVDDVGDMLGCDIQVIDTKQWTVKDCLVPKGRVGKLNFECLVLIGDELHNLYEYDAHTYRHCVLNKESGNVIQEPIEIHPELFVVNRANFIASRGSIIAFGESKKGDTIIVEYSLATKQWQHWEWTSVFLKDYSNQTGNFVAVMNGRYILSFGGRRDKRYTQIDSILIYDVERKQCLGRELKLPVRSHDCQAVLMADQNRDELLTSGFVRRCYKAEEFRDVCILPTPLITIIGKYVAMEFVHLILATKRGNHYRINIDDILNCQRTV